MDELTRLSLNDFLERTAARTPTPGGGSVCALAAALSCALARMVAAYSISSKSTPDVTARIDRACGQLRTAQQLLCALVTQDAEAYAELNTTAKKLKDDPSAAAAHLAAVRNALAVPMEVAAVASNALAMMDEQKGLTAPGIRSDLGIAATLAEASARAAAYLVGANLVGIADDAESRRIREEIDRIVDHCRDRLRRIESSLTTP